MPEKLFENALEQTEEALKENGTSVSLTEKNYADELERMIASQSGITVMAVSYTHLDVYKRQYGRCTSAGIW